MPAGASQLNPSPLGGMTHSPVAPEPDRPILRKAIALVELLGTAWAFIAAVSFLLHLPTARYLWSFVALFFGFYTLVGYAGAQLYRGRAIGWFLSVFAQLLQLVRVTAGAISFRFVAGPEVTLYLVGGPYRLFFGVTSSVGFLRGDSEPGPVIAVNLLALAILVALALVRDRAPAPVMPPN